MSPRRSLGLPITLAIVMIVLLVTLTVGWVVLAVFLAILDTPSAPLYWTVLSVGTTFLIILVLGVVWYLILSIKAINLGRRQSNFIDSVTHELKSPIASLKLCLQTLGRRQVDRRENADFHRFMLEDVERLDQLINQVLDAGRLDKRRLDEEELEDVDLPSVLRECVESVCLRYRVEASAVALDLPLCRVPARRADLEIIFRNLIDNAVKYAGTDPRVEVTLLPTSGAGVVARIADNGPGIPRKMRRKIFGRFERLGLELERQKPGTGLGLFIVRTLVRRLRGRIAVHDRDGGPGTVFEVRLPRAAVDAEESQSPTFTRRAPS